MIRKNLFYILGLLIPVILFFKVFFVGGELVWGDAPYFHHALLRELFSEPLAWSQQNVNFGSVNIFLFMSPIMMLYGALNVFLGLSNDAIIRLVFYFPSLILTVFSSWFFAKKMGFSRRVGFVTCLVYTLNTYFLLLVDGGQVGVLLAYGLFPLSLLTLMNPGYQTIIVMIILTLVDPRIAIVSLITYLTWFVINFLFDKKAVSLNDLGRLFLIFIVVAALSAYWVIPVTLGGGVDLSTSVLNLNFQSLTHSLTLFQPHWPNNQYGEVNNIPFYFFGNTLLIIFGIFTGGKDKRLLKLGLVFLVLGFLLKGGNYPLGIIYRTFVDIVPFGNIIRDSSKFFAPVILFAGILIGNLFARTKNKYVLVAGYFFVLFLVLPAITGSMHFVLSGRGHDPEIYEINERILDSDNFSRSAWFPEREPVGVKSKAHPALDAKYLTDLRPIARLNVGSADKFNFLHNPQYVDWFKLMGIKHLIFSGDPRKFELNDKEKEDWRNLTQLASTDSALIDQSIGEIPYYTTKDINPEIFSVDKLYAIVGNDSVYDYLEENVDDFSISNQAFAFFEDGLLDPKTLEGVASDSAALVFNEKDENDLVFSFLQDYFYPLSNVSEIDWAFYDAEDYLTWKYQLLIRDIDIKEFDYGKGIALSTNKGEQIKFNVDIPENGNYKLAIRLIGEAGVAIGDKTIDASSSYDDRFEWQFEGFDLAQGKQEITITNLGDTAVFNVLAVIPESEWQEAQAMTNTFVNHFTVIRGLKDLKENITNTNWASLETEKIGTLKTSVNQSPGFNWVIFTNNYTPDWKLLKGIEYKNPVAVYSSFNGYYVDSSWGEVTLEYIGQKNFRWGAYISVLALLGLTVFFFWRKA